MYVSNSICYTVPSPSRYLDFFYLQKNVYFFLYDSFVIGYAKPSRTVAYGQLTMPQFGGGNGKEKERITLL